MTHLARILTMGAFACSATCFPCDEPSWDELVNLKYEVWHHGDSHKALQGAQDAFLSQYQEISSKAFEIFQELVQKGLGAEEALVAAQSWKNDRSEQVQCYSLALFNILLEIGHQAQWVATEANELRARGLDISDLEEDIENFRG